LTLVARTIQCNLISILFNKLPKELGLRSLGSAFKS
jgi:hypothetical protein